MREGKGEEGKGRVPDAQIQRRTLQRVPRTERELAGQSWQGLARGQRQERGEGAGKRTGSRIDLLWVQDGGGEGARAAERTQMNVSATIDILSPLAASALSPS